MLTVGHVSVRSLFSDTGRVERRVLSASHIFVPGIEDIHNQKRITDIVPGRGDQGSQWHSHTVMRPVKAITHNSAYLCCRSQLSELSWGIMRPSVNVRLCLVDGISPKRYQRAKVHWDYFNIGIRICMLDFWYVFVRMCMCVYLTTSLTVLHASGCCVVCSEPWRSCSEEVVFFYNQTKWLWCVFHFHWPRMLAFIAVGGYWREIYRDFNVCWWLWYRICMGNPLL